jgi:hypothetical protein
MTTSIPTGSEEAFPDATTADDVGPLLGITSSAIPTIEKAGDFQIEPNDDAGIPLRSPLLGTSTSQGIENSRGSSERRSPESICYPKLLRENGPASGRKSRKIAPVEGRFAGRDELLGRLALAIEKLALYDSCLTQFHCPLDQSLPQAQAHLLAQNPRPRPSL